MSAGLEELIRVASELTPRQLRKLTVYAHLITKPYWELPGYSDEWTDEDLRDATRESMRQFEEEHPDEDWGELKPMNPGKRYK